MRSPAERPAGDPPAAGDSADGNQHCRPAGIDGCAATWPNGTGPTTVTNEKSERGHAAPIRVFLVDDQTVVRRGLRFMLRALQDIELVGEAASAEEALAVCTSLRPDVVLMDLQLPGQDGIAAMRALQAIRPDQRMVALSGFDHPDYVRGALQAGAAGYLLKTASAEEIAEAIRLANCGQVMISPALIPVLVASLASARPQAPPLGRDLSDRELEVLALLVQGLSNRQIAERLTIVPATVKYHLQQLRQKLGASRRTELVAIALRHQIVQPPQA